MSTLNARANQAWILVEAESEFGFESDSEAFEEGWEIGYKTAREDVMGAVEWLRARAGDEAIGTADTRWAYKRAADFLAREIGEEAAS